MSRLPDSLASRFEVVRLLGRGGFGRVFEAKERRGARVGALKLIARQGDGERELREARIAAKLRDPGLIEVYEVGAADDEVYLFLELADGTLEDRLDQADPAEALALLADAGGGLVALHQAGLVHRDVKPANVLRVHGRGKLADLGLVRGTDLPTLTATGVILGTPDYLAPEQARGERATAASDVFAYAAVAYRILTGRTIHPGMDASSILVAAARGEDRPGSPRRFPPGPACDVLEAALARDPSARPEAIPELVGALRELASEPPRPVAETTRRVGLGRPASPSGNVTGARSTGRGLRRRLASLAGAVAIAALVAWGLQRPAPGPATAPPPTSPKGDPIQEAFQLTWDALEELVDDVLEAPDGSGFLNSDELAALPPEQQRRRVDDPVVLRFLRFRRRLLEWARAAVAAGRGDELDGFSSVMLEHRLETFLYGYRNMLRTEMDFDAKRFLDNRATATLDPLVADRAKRIFHDIRDAALSMAVEIQEDPEIPGSLGLFMALRIHSISREGSTWRYLEPAIEQLASRGPPDAVWLRAMAIWSAIRRYGDVIPGRCEDRSRMMREVLSRLPPSSGQLPAPDFSSLVERLLGLEVRILGWCGDRDAGVRQRMRAALDLWVLHPAIRTDWERSRAQMGRAMVNNLEEMPDFPESRRIREMLDEYLDAPAPPEGPTTGS